MGEEVEEGGWWVYGKERASRIEGDTDQHNRHCQPTRSSRFYVWGFGSLPLTRARASPDHSLFPSALLFFRSLIVSAHTAPSVIPTLSRQLQLHSPPVHWTLLPHPVLVLCSFATSSALHRFASNPASEPSGVTYHRLLRHPKLGVLSHIRRCKAQSTSTTIVPS